MIKRINKMIAVILFVTVLCMCVPTISYAGETNVETVPMDVLSISLPDENGDMVVYHLSPNSEIEIPIYAMKEGVKRGVDLEKLATLVIGESDGRLKFVFIPVSVPIGLATLGFSGEFQSYMNGIRYGYNPYTAVMEGNISKPATGTARLSGIYSVFGYEDVNILRVILF